jgi:hypothetical protein
MSHGPRLRQARGQVFEAAGAACTWASLQSTPESAAADTDADVFPIADTVVYVVVIVVVDSLVAVV